MSVSSITTCAFEGRSSVDLLEMQEPFSQGGSPPQGIHVASDVCKQGHLVGYTGHRHFTPVLEVCQDAVNYVSVHPGFDEEVTEYIDRLKEISVHPLSLQRIIWPVDSSLHPQHGQILSTSCSCVV